MTSTKNGDGVNAVAVLLEELRESTRVEALAEGQ